MANPEMYARVRELFNQFSGASENELLTIGNDFRELIGQAARDAWGAEFVNIFTPDEREIITEYLGTHEVLIDRLFTNAVLRGEIDSPDDYAFQPMYDRLAKIEADALNLEHGDSVVHIGSGAMPGTAIGLHKLGISTICVEQDPAVAVRSVEVLKRFGLHGTGKIRVVISRGQDVDLVNQKVIVSAMVPDKSAIFQSVRMEPYNGCVMAFRQPSNFLHALEYPTVSDQFLAGRYSQLWSSSLPGDLDPLRATVVIPGYQVGPEKICQVVPPRDHLIPLTT